MTRQRGNVYFYILAAIVVLGLIVAGIAEWKSYISGVEENGYKRGKSEVQHAWDVANEKATAEKETARLAREAEAAVHVKELAAAQGVAADYEAKWRNANAKNVKPLAVCGTPAQRPQPPALATAGGVAVGAPANDGAVPAGDSGSAAVQFTAEFVREYDSAWTDKAGQPVFVDPGVDAGAAGDTYSVAEIIANHGQNASRCSANARAQNELIDLIVRLRSQ